MRGETAWRLLLMLSRDSILITVNLEMTVFYIPHLRTQSSHIKRCFNCKMYHEVGQYVNQYPKPREKGARSKFSCISASSVPPSKETFGLQVAALYMTI